MANFDPNHPPEKEARVTLKSWEYTDPIGVPHPDFVELVVEVRNESGVPIKSVIPQGKLQWLEGDQSRRTRPAWTVPSPLSVGQPFELAAGERKTIRVAIDLASKMQALETSHRWPWAARVSFSGLGQPLQVELPIRPGD